MNHLTESSASDANESKPAGAEFGSLGLSSGLVQLEVLGPNSAELNVGMSTPYLDVMVTAALARLKE